MELPVHHLKRAMAPDKWLRASGANHAVNSPWKSWCARIGVSRSLHLRVRDRRA